MDTRYRSSGRNLDSSTPLTPDMLSGDALSSVANTANYITDRGRDAGNRRRESIRYKEYDGQAMLSQSNSRGSDSRAAYTYMTSGIDTSSEYIDLPLSESLRSEQSTGKAISVGSNGSSPTKAPNETETNPELLSLYCDRLRAVVKRHERDLLDLRTFSNLERESLEDLLEEQRKMTLAEISKAKELEERLKSLENELENVKSKRKEFQV